jgi:hypothetical protein
MFYHENVTILLRFDIMTISWFILQNLKPSEMLRTTGKCIVTCGIVKDKMVIVGKRDGGVEALILDQFSKLSCKVRIMFVHVYIYILGSYIFTGQSVYRTKAIPAE